MFNNTVTWHSLKSHAEKIRYASIASFLANEQERQEHFCICDNRLTLDATYALADQRTLDLLLQLARDTRLEEMRDKMFSGEAINITENRAVLHTALRAKNPRPKVKKSLEAMCKFTQKIHNEDKIKTIVNIGIGGSDLGPRMVYHALKDTHKKLDVHYVANIDGHDLHSVLQHCKAEETLFIIASKTFTTIETLTNAQTAKNWFVKEAGKDKIAEHFVALSTNFEEAKTFGIAEDHIFPFEDWVGGRFSLWSSIGLSLCLGLGFDIFEELLSGARSMDEHFSNAPLEQNMPVLMGLLGFWYRTFLDMPALACLPYDQRLELLPAWLQQLDMESNGKAVSRDGNTIPYPTGPIIFGQPGTNGQHAFYQHLHQSSTITPCEFIGIETPGHPYKDQHKILLANLKAQAQALMEGKTAPDGQPYRGFSGNRPSLTLILPSLSPYHLGQLLALYEHKVFVQGILWDINSFDQWGVELGKALAKEILRQDK